MKLSYLTQLYIMATILFLLIMVVFYLIFLVLGFVID
jgi:hypothetical protein